MSFGHITKRAALPASEQKPVKNWPIMGYGKVAIGGGLQPGGTSALLYMDMGETRAIDADTTDLFPVGSFADPDKLLACIHFKDGAAMQQTIDVIREMQLEIGYTHSPDSAARVNELEAEMERFKRLWDAAEDHNHALRTDASALKEKLRVAREALTCARKHFGPGSWIGDKISQALATIGEE